MRIRDILKEKGGDVATIGAGRTVHEAVRELNSHRIGAIVVTDDSGSVQGIVSERDVLRMAAETWDDGGDRVSRLRDRPVVGIMTREVICAVPDDDVDYAMGIMTQNRMVRANLSQAAYENRMLKDYVQGGGLG